MKDERDVIQSYYIKGVQTALKLLTTYMNTCDRRKKETQHLKNVENMICTYVISLENGTPNPFSCLDN